MYKMGLVLILLIATGIAHAQIGGVGGTISNPDGTPAAGVTVEAPGFGNIPMINETGADGTYFIPYISTVHIVITVGDTITLQVTDTEGNVIERRHTVTAADTAAGTVTFNITLPLLGDVNSTEGTYMYWVQWGRNVQRANLDGSDVTDLVGWAALDIALDVEENKMYWTEASVREILRSDLDGSNVEVILSESQAPTNIALDVDGNKMYWLADINQGAPQTVLRANFDGSDQEVLLTTHDTWFNDIALDLQEGKIYLAARSLHKIQRINFDGSEREDVIAAWYIGAIALDEQSRKIYWAKENITDPGGTMFRADLDGSNAEEIRGTSDTLISSIALDVQSRKIYWTEEEEYGLIGRCNFDGTEPETLVMDLFYPRGLALMLPSLEMMPEEGMMDEVPWVRMGDVNRDGVIDNIDLALVALNYGRTGGQLEADVNRDGVVNVTDVVIVFNEMQSNFQPLAPLASQQMSEIFTLSNVKLWLADAERLDHSDVRVMKAILFLEQALASLTPKETVLLPNYPNPFNPETWIPYQLSSDSDVQIRIYDSNGVLVRRLELGHQLAGYYTEKNRAAYWEGRNDFGEPVANGVYFYQLEVGDISPLRKMVILK